MYLFESGNPLLNGRYSVSSTRQSTERLDYYPVLRRFDRLEQLLAL